LSNLNGNKFYQHAYFPQWAFDEVQSYNKWTFGVKGDSYIALYSHEPTRWVSDYELRVESFKNVWIVELGSIDEYGSFNQFVSDILQSNIEITPLALGYNVHYNSHSQGAVSVSWDGPMYVSGNKADLGPYPRFDNDYCYQEFGTKTMSINFETQSLELDFDSISRIYQSN